MILPWCVPGHAPSCPWCVPCTILPCGACCAVHHPAHGAYCAVHHPTLCRAPLHAWYMPCPVCWLTRGVPRAPGCALPMTWLCHGTCHACRILRYLVFRVPSCRPCAPGPAHPQQLGAAVPILPTPPARPFACRGRAASARPRSGSAPAPRGNAPRLCFQGRAPPSLAALSLSLLRARLTARPPGKYRLPGAGPVLAVASLRVSTSLCPSRPLAASLCLCPSESPAVPTLSPPWSPPWSRGAGSRPGERWRCSTGGARVPLTGTPCPPQLWHAAEPQGAEELAPGEPEG